MIILLYTFLVICFDWYKEKIICLISFNKFSELLLAFTCARVIGNLWSICLGVNILSPVPVVDFNGNDPALKPLITNSLPSYRFFAVLETFLLFFLSSSFFGLALLLKFTIYSTKSVCSWSVRLL